MTPASPRRSSSLFRSCIPAFLALTLAAPAFAGGKKVEVWLTTPDKANLLKQQDDRLSFNSTASNGTVITVDDEQKFQTIDGFGHAVTGGTAQLMMKMSPATRTALLKELFGHGKGEVRMNYIRVSIGASDMNDHVYTYDDIAPGSTDISMNRFSLQPDKADVLPVLKQIVAIQPGIKILASPWTSPSWMKDNELPKGGTLKKEFYGSYALYLVRYVQAMKEEGIPIAALTVQNEPENPKNTPSLVFTAEQEADFIGNYLGPMMAKAGLHTEIVAFDHNCDHPEYPIAVLKDPAAGKYTGGSGFHLYRGEISALTTTHDAAPDKNIYFTEQMVVPRRNATDFGIAQPTARVLIAATNNWSRNVLLWNLAADPNNGPHTNDGGCPSCSGAMTLDGDKVTRSIAYYVTAHVTPFVSAGSVRIGSASAPDALPHVAFRTPKGGHVLLVSNNTAAASTFAIRYNGKDAIANLPAGAVATYVW